MKYFILTIVMCFSIGMKAQYFEVGLHGGLSNYQGDLTPSTLWNSVGETHTVVGGFVRYNLNKYLAARLTFSKGTISGTDRNADDPLRRQRNLHFESSIYELSLTAEVNLFGYTPSNLYSDFSPYILVGGGVFRFNPQTDFQERWIELQTLGTEGQGLPGYGQKYNLTQLTLIGGGGFKYNLNEEWTVGIELGARKTFTDYLDDVGGGYANYYDLLDGNGSDAAALGNREGEFLGTDPVVYEARTGTRGNSGSLDWYFFGSVTVSYNFVFKGIYSSSVSSRHLGCPRKF